MVKVSALKHLVNEVLKISLATTVVWLVDLVVVSLRYINMYIVILVLLYMYTVSDWELGL